MAVSDKLFNITGEERVFSSDVIIKGETYYVMFLDVLGDNNWTPIDKSRMRVINNSVVFDVGDAPQGTKVNLQVATTPEELTTTPQDASIVASNIADIVINATNIEAINTNATNMSSILNVETNITAITNLSSISNELVILSGIEAEMLSLYADKAKLDSLYADKAKLDSLYADKAKLDSLYADKAKLDSLYTDKAKLDSLYADKAKLDSLYADKAKLDSIYANLIAILDSEANASEALGFRNEALGFRNEAEQFKLDAEQLPIGELNTLAGELSAVQYPSQLVRGSISVDNKVKTPTQVATPYTGNDTSQGINVGMSLIDFTQAGNGTGYYLGRYTNGSVVEKEGSVIHNSTFTSNYDGWTAGSSTLSIVNGRLRVTNTSTYGVAVLTLTGLDPNKEYLVRASAYLGTVSARIDADFEGLDGNGNVGITGTSGTFFSIGKSASDGTLVIQLYAIAGTVGDYAEFDNVVVREHEASGHIDFGSIAGIDGVGKAHIKSRSQVYNNLIYDGLRGDDEYIITNLTSVESSNVTNGLQFSNTGFTVSGTGATNADTHTYVAYTTLYNNISWTMTNHGKLCVTAYNPQSLDVMCYYEGSGIAGHELPILLGRELSLIYNKNLTTVTNWLVQNNLDGSGKYLLLNESNNEASATSVQTVSSSYGISVGTSGWTNAVREDHILYGFANAYFNDDGKLVGNKECGTYIGTGTSGNKVTTLGKPAEITVKGLSIVGSWHKGDNKRLTSGSRNFITLDTSAVEGTNTDYDILFNTNSFEVAGVGAGTTWSEWNADQEQYLYISSYDTDYNGGGAYQMLPSPTSNLQLDVTVNLGGSESKNLDIVETVDTSSVTESGEYYVLEVI